MAPRLHPISVIVFLIGAVLAATGITLAIVFGVKECSCPVCPSASPPSNSRTDCSARLFAIRTGVDNTVLPWSDDLLNSSSIAFQNATDMLNTQLSQTLQSGPSSQSFAQISDSQPDNVNYVVSVTKFVKGQNAIVIAYASAAVTGENGVIQSFQNVTDVANQKLTNDQNVTVEPMVNYNSMQFCDVPNTNLSRPDPLNGNPDCPSTTCPVITCPSPSPAPSCPTCPDCPGGVTCPPPVSCPTDSSPSSCPDCPTASCPTSSPGPSSPSTCPVCENSTCPPPIVCSTTVSPANSPSTSVSSIMTTPSCPPCPSVSSPTSSPLPFTCPTCPEPTPCPSVSTSFSCPVCPSSSSCPTSPAPTCPMNSCPTFPSLEPTGTTRISSPLTIATVSSTVPTSQSSSSTTTRTTAPPITSSSTSPKTTVSSTSQGTQRTSSTSSTVTASHSAGIRSTRQGTSQNPVTESSTGTGTSQSPVTGTIPSSTASSYSPTTSQQSTTASFYSPTTSQQSSTLTTTFPATTTVSCPGGTFVYDGDLAIVFEVTYIADSSAFDAQNLMMNTFISTQLLNYGNFGAESHQVGAYDFSSTKITKMIGVPYPLSAQNPASSDNFMIGPRDIFAFNSVMSTADIFVRNMPGFTEAHIKDGLDYVSTATGRGKFSAVVIVGISDDFVSEAVASSQQLQDAGYHVFTVVLNSTSNFTSLATDSNSSFTLPYPRSSSDANRISIDIGNYLVSQSFQCFGAITTVPTTTAPSTVTTTRLSTTTTQYCRYEFLSSNVIYVFEATTNISLTEMSTSFLSTFLISEAQADLRDTVTWSPYTNFSLIQYPSSNKVHDAIGCCDIGQPTQLTYAQMLSAMEIIANVNGLTSTSTGINEGLLFAQSEFGAGNGAIVLFATSTDGVAAAQATATNIQANNISIVTVSVGGQFDLNPLSSPGFQTHYLTDQTDEQALSQEIIRDLKTLGTICVQ